MKTILRLALGSVLAGATLTASAASNDLLVKFKPNASTKLLNTGIGARTIKSYPQIGWELVRLPSNLTTDRASRYYKALSTVAAVEKPTKGKFFAVPNDPLYGPTVGENHKQYHHAQIGMPGAWEITLGSPSVTVAILDSGFRRTHEDLITQLRPDSISTVGDTNTPDLTDEEGHGTHVAGLAGATANNGRGGAGTGWNVRLLGVKIGDAGVEVPDVVDGLMYAADHNVQVINMSFGFPEYSQAIADAIQYAHGKDIVLVAAAGNDNETYVGYPALLPNVLTVGSTDQGGGKSDFSNYGSEVDVAAPGGRIISTSSKGDREYEVYDGTSMAAPITAGAIGLMRSYAPALPASEIVNALKSTAIQGSTRFTNFGQINVFAAMIALPVGVKTDLNPTSAAVVASEGTIVNPTGTPTTDSSYLIGADNSALEIRSAYKPSIGTVAGMTTDITVSSPRDKILTSRLHMSVKAASGVTMLVMLQNPTTGAYDLFTSVRLSTSTSTLDYSFPRSVLLKYLKSNNTMRVMLRSINPSRLSPGGTPFRASIDSVGLLISARN